MSNIMMDARIIRNSFPEWSHQWIFNALKNVPKNWNVNVFNYIRGLTHLSVWMCRLNHESRTSFLSMELNIIDALELMEESMAFQGYEVEKTN